MEPWQAAVVGVVQGLTEFLPVSSSGHIVFIERLLGVEDTGLRFTIIVHLGTLVAVVVALWYRVAPVARGTVSGIVGLARGHSSWSDRNFRWGIYVLAGTVPAAVFGLSVEHYVAAAFEDPRTASGALLITGALLFATRFVPANTRDMGWASTVAVGCAQALAIFPGISRSGTTIATGLFMGVERQSAAEFSFLLSIPVILGPSLMTIGSLASVPGSELVNLALGFVVSAVSGYFAIKMLLRFVQQGRLSWFAYYCWLVGILGLAYF